MKAIEKKTKIESLGFQVSNGFNPATNKDFVRVGKLNTKNGIEDSRDFATIHTAYKSIIG
jgi:hypothetical protein